MPPSESHYSRFILVDENGNAVNLSGSSSSPTGTATSETRLTEIRDRLPATGVPSSQQITTIVDAIAKLATDAILIQVRDRLPSTGAPSSAQVTSIIGAIANLATDAVIKEIRDRLPAQLVNGKLSVNLSDLPLPTNAAKDATLVEVRDRLPAQLVNGKLPVSFSEAPLATDAAKNTTLSEVRDRLQQFSSKPLTAYNPSTQFGVPQLYRVVDPSTPPAYNPGDLAFPSCDMRGAPLVNPGISTESSPSSVSASSNSVNYSASDAIDLRGYDAIAIIPTVTTSGGVTGTYKIQWSFDAANWWNETLDTGNPMSGGEISITQSPVTRTFASDSLGIKPNSAAVLTKKGRWVRVAQKSDGAVSLVTSYNYQMF